MPPIPSGLAPFGAALRAGNGRDAAARAAQDQDLGGSEPGSFTDSLGAAMWQGHDHPRVVDHPPGTERADEPDPGRAAAPRRKAAQAHGPADVSTGDPTSNAGPAGGAAVLSVPVTTSDGAAASPPVDQAAVALDAIATGGADLGPGRRAPDQPAGRSLAAGSIAPAEAAAGPGSPLDLALPPSSSARPATHAGGSSGVTAAVAAAPATAATLTSPPGLEPAAEPADGVTPAVPANPAGPPTPAPPGSIATPPTRSTAAAPADSATPADSDRVAPGTTQPGDGTEPAAPRARTATERTPDATGAAAPASPAATRSPDGPDAGAPAGGAPAGGAPAGGQAHADGGHEPRLASRGTSDDASQAGPIARDSQRLGQDAPAGPPFTASATEVRTTTTTGAGSTEAAVADVERLLDRVVHQIRTVGSQADPALEARLQDPDFGVLRVLVTGRAGEIVRAELVVADQRTAEALRQAVDRSATGHGLAGIDLRIRTDPARPDAGANGSDAGTGGRPNPDQPGWAGMAGGMHREFERDRRELHNGLSGSGRAPITPAPAVEVIRRHQPGPGALDIRA